MGVPTSEVSYTPAMPRRDDHEVHKGHVMALEEKNTPRKYWYCLSDCTEQPKMANELLTKMFALQFFWQFAGETNRLIRLETSCELWKCLRKCASAPAAPRGGRSSSHGFWTATIALHTNTYCEDDRLPSVHITTHSLPFTTVRSEANSIMKEVARFTMLRHIPRADRCNV